MIADTSAPVFFYSSCTAHADPASVLKTYLAAAPRTEAQLLAELRRIVTARSLNDQQRFRVLVEAVFNTAEPKTIGKQISTQAPMFAKV